jgi:hypothetical protein
MLNTTKIVKIDTSNNVDEFGEEFVSYDSTPNSSQSRYFGNIRVDKKTTEDEFVLITNHTKNHINDYITSCSKKAHYHNNSALRAKQWNNIMNLFGVFLVSSQALVMTIQSVNDVSNIDVTITGAIFAFLIAVSGKFKDMYEFQVLACHHSNAADEYAGLKNSFHSLVNDIELGRYDENIYNQYMLKYIYTNEKSHIQPVIDCKYLFCCFGKISETMSTADNIN